MPLYDRFRRALIAACERGVHVQLLLDAFGSDELAGAYWREFERCGGELRWFNPMRLLRLIFRNHRKLLIIDGVTAFVGGFNLADGYDGDGIRKGWRDLALELRGPLVTALAINFDQMWGLAAFEPSDFRRFAHAHAVPNLDARQAQLLLAGPGCRRVAYAANCRRFRTARRVSLHAAYFLPPGNLVAC